MAPKKHVIAYSVLGVLLAVSIGSGVYLFRQVNQLKANPQQQAQAQVAATVAQVGKLMILPTGEEPTVATVSDPSKLKDQAFFADAQVGDTVLLYINAKQAILYRPSANKIVEVAPISTTDTGTTPTTDAGTSTKTTTPATTPAATTKTSS